MIITDIALDQSNRTVSLSFDNGSSAELSCEYLRVHSPSAEVRGHGPGQEVLQTGKEMVNIVAIEPDFSSGGFNKPVEVANQR